MNQVEINGHLQKPKDHSTSCSSAKLLLQTTCPPAAKTRAPRDFVTFKRPSCVMRNNYREAV